MMYTESEIALAFENFAFLAHRFLVDEDMSVEQVIDEMLTFPAVRGQKWAAFLATEERIVRGIEAHLGNEYKGETVEAWFGKVLRDDRRTIFKAVSELCARLRKGQ